MATQPDPNLDPLEHIAQSLDAGSVAALPEGLRVELEGVEDAGGVRFLQEMAAQLRVRRMQALTVADSSVSAALH